MANTDMRMVNSFDASSTKDLPPQTRDLVERRQRSLGAAYRLFYSNPVHFTRGEGVLLFDAEGRDYLDAYNNVPVVGHSNLAVHDAVSAQLLRLNTHTRYLTDGVISYAERLLALFPPYLDNVVFACTGSEAVDLALRVSRHVTGRRGVVATRHAYHGTTQSAAEVSPSLGKGNSIPDHVELVDAPDHVRDPVEGAADAFGERTRQAIDRLRMRGYDPAALLLDTSLSSDGLQVDPAGLLAPAVEAIREAGGLFIADEVQAGFGRTGGWWGFTRHGIEPDLVVLGKPMGNGIPISAVVGRSDLLDAFGKEVRYFNTFGGNPVSVAAADAVLDQIIDRGLLLNATRVGADIARDLHPLVAKDPGVAAVRQTGLFIAIEFVEGAMSQRPDAARAAAMVNGMRERRVLDQRFRTLRQRPQDQTAACLRQRARAAAGRSIRRDPDSDITLVSAHSARIPPLQNRVGDSPEERA